MTTPSDLPEPLDVIAVGAHPDDVEIAIGGTLFDAYFSSQAIKLGFQSQSLFLDSEALFLDLG